MFCFDFKKTKSYTTLSILNTLRLGALPMQICSFIFVLVHKDTDTKYWNFKNWFEWFYFINRTISFGVILKTGRLKKMKLKVENISFFVSQRSNLGIGQDFFQCWFSRDNEFFWTLLMSLCRAAYILFVSRGCSCQFQEIGKFERHRGRP